MKYFIILFLLVSNSLAQLAHATSFWISGAWVNVRESATTSALVIAQLPTNTEVTLIKTEDKFSLFEFKQNNSSKQGFIANSFLANKPLTLADISRDEEGDKVRKTFWISPSLQNLFSVGDYYNRLYLKSNPEYLEKPTKPYNAKAFPEYEAMKSVFKSGLVMTNRKISYQDFSDFINEHKRFIASEKNDPNYNGIDSKAYKDAIEALDFYRKKHTVQVSLFKTEQGIIGANATLEDFSSYLQKELTISNISLPKWNCYDDSYGCNYKGKWDIGGLTATVNKEVYLTAINIQGLISSLKGFPKQDYDFSYAEDSCNANIHYNPNYYTHIKSTPKIKNPILWFYTTSQIPFTRAKISNFEFSANKKTLKITDIDIDTDGIPDLSKIEGTGLANVSYEYTEYDYLIMININGSWKLLSNYYQPSCF